MGLRVSTLAPQPSPKLIDPESFKPSFDLVIPGLDKELCDLTCGMVKQTLNLTANQNRLRTYTYNILAKDDWRSAEFADLCTYAGGYCLSSFLKENRNRQINDNKEQGRLNFRQHMAAKVPEATALWMTTKIYDDPELESVLPPSLYSKSIKLNKTYLESKRDIQAMQLDQNTMLQVLQLLGQQQNAQGMMNAAAGNQLVNVNLNGQMIQMTQAQALQLQQAMGQQQQQNNNGAAAILAGLSGGNNNNNNAVASLLSALTGNNNRPGNNETLTGVSAVIAASQQSNSSFNTAAPSQGNNNGNDSSLLRNWRKSRGEEVNQPTEISSISIGTPTHAETTSVSIGANSSGINLTATPVVQEPVKEREPQPKPKVDYGMKALKITGGSEGSFSKLNSTFLGFKLDHKESVYEKLTESNNKLRAEASLKDEGESTKVRYVDKSPVLRSSVSDVVNAIRENKAVVDKDSPSMKGELFIGLGMMYQTVYFNGEQSKDVFDVIIKSCTSSAKVRLSMEGAIAGIKEVGAEWGVGKIREDLASAELIDQWMTDHVNRYLSTNLNSPLSLESFTYDYPDLERMLASQLGASVSIGLSTYLDKVVAALPLIEDPVISDVISPEGEGIESSALIEQCAMMLIPYNISQLGISVVGERNYIDKTINPVLSSLIDTLVIHCAAAEYDVSSMYLVTTDNKIFRVNETGLDIDNCKYVISKYSVR